MATEAPEADQKVSADDELRLTDEGIELPEWLRGYTGSFTLRTGSIDGEFNTTDEGLPDAEFYDGVIASYPGDGDWNPQIPEGHLILTAPGEPEWCYNILDERTDSDD